MEHDLFAVTTYSYDDRTSLGRLTASDTDAIIHRFDNAVPHHFSMKINHRNYLPCLVVDEASGVKIHRGTNTSFLESYITQLRNDGISPVMRYQPVFNWRNEDGPPPVLPDFYYVPSQFREIVRGIVSFVVYLHSEGKSLDRSLSLQEHFVVEDSTVKYWRVGFRDADPTSKMEDFRYVAAIIDELFRDIWALLPSDMRDFAETIDGCCGRLLSANGEKSLLEHLALLSSSNRIARVSFYSEMEYRVKNQHRIDYHAALRKANHTSIDWTSTFTQSLQYWPARTSFYHPVQIKYPRKTYEQLMVDGDISVHYGDRPTDKDQASGYLRFGRNMATHLADNFKQCYRTVANEEDIDCIMMYTLGDFLLEFHSYLSHQLINFIAKSSA